MSTLPPGDETAPMFPIMGGPKVPWSLIAPYEAQALKNHYQTLKRLAERGGLSICEAMAVMSSVAYEKRPIAKPTVEDWLDFIAQRKAKAEQRDMPAAWIDVLAERRRQSEAEGWSRQHDDEHGNGELARAASAYALEHAAWTYTDRPSTRLREAARSLWPWGREWWKPGAGRRMLVKAAALLLAEIERLDRKEGAR